MVWSSRTHLSCHSEHHSSLLGQLASANIIHIRILAIKLGKLELILCTCRRFQWVGALGPISVATLSITAVYLGNLQQKAGIAIVGSISGGLPGCTISWWFPMNSFPRLAATAVVISFVSLLESISIARALAEPQQDVLHPLDPNQELLGRLVFFVAACWSLFKSDETALPNGCHSCGHQLCLLVGVHLHCKGFG